MLRQAPEDGAEPGLTVCPLVRERKLTRTPSPPRSDSSAKTGGATVAHPSDGHPLLHLQRMVGNQAVQQRISTKPTANPSAIDHRPALIQAAPNPKTPTLDGAVLGTN